MDKVQIPGSEVPSFRTFRAIERGVEKNILFTTWGGIGDQICAEPTLRFAIDSFKDCHVSLATENPGLYRHLKFKKVYDLKKTKPIYENFLVFETIPDPKRLTFEFVSHMVTHCVDFPALASLRCQTPISYRSVILKPEVSLDRQNELKQYTDAKYVAVHAGRHWPSKTFPKDWWDSMLAELIHCGLTPVLFGKDEEDQGTVATETKGCVDLRGITSLDESIWLLQRMQTMVTNDSSPMHMAATGDARIAFIASAKHQDYLYHWRKGEWGANMKHFNKGGVWDVVSHNPNQKDDVLVDKVDEDLLRTWLPQPQEVSKWILEQC